MKFSNWYLVSENTNRYVTEIQEEIPKQKASNISCQYPTFCIELINLHFAPFLLRRSYISTDTKIL